MPINDCSIDALVPRGLVSSGLVFDAPISVEGLIALRISWKNERITKIESINPSLGIHQKLLLPRLVEPHAHIDKAFTWKNFPNLSGTYQSALEANLEEHKTRNSKDVHLRAEQALNCALRNGLRAIRSHIDSFGCQTEETWEVLRDLKNKWSKLIELQFVALVPLEFWESDEGDLLATRIASQGGLLGGVIVPPFNKKSTYQSILKMLELANRFQCGVDIHIDESQDYPGAGLKILMNVLDNIKVNIPINCSHSSSMSMLPCRQLRILAERLAAHKVNVVALPLTNSWLLGRSSEKTPYKRPLAPIYQLQKAGVNVSVGGDNVQDPWFPGGNFDPISLMSFTLPIAQLAPWQRLGLAPFTTAPSLMMGLEWLGDIGIGSPADFILLESSSWAEALATTPKRMVIIKGKFLDTVNKSLQNSLEAL